MRSMTGFGRAELSRDGVRVTAEVRALNQRFLELKLALPRGWGEYEAQIRKIVQEAVARGRVEVAIRKVALKPRAGRLIVSDELARRYVSELRRLAKSLGLHGDLGLQAVLQRPEIFQIVEAEEETSKREVNIGLSALKAALAALERERSREGRELKRDLAGHLSRIRTTADRIAKLAERSRAAIVAGFQYRMRELLGFQPPDEKRLYEEASSIAQRADISEELARLSAHIKGLGELVARSGPVGKEIEFLLQEVNREVNTIGSKSQNAELSRMAVEIKGSLEKMREQVQNVE